MEYTHSLIIILIYIEYNQYNHSAAVILLVLTFAQIVFHAKFSINFDLNISLHTIRNLLETKGFDEN